MVRATQYGDQKLAVLDEINERVRRHSAIPTIRELAERFGISPATMHSWLTRLAGEGLVEWTRGRHRSLRCTVAGLRLIEAETAGSGQGSSTATDTADSPSVAPSAQPWATASTPRR